MRLWGPERAAAACKPRRFFLSLIAGLSYGAPRPSPVRRPRSDPRVRPPPSRSARLNALSWVPQTAPGRAAALGRSEAGALRAVCMGLAEVQPRLDSPNSG